MQKFMLGAYWGPRPAGIEECVRNTAHLFAGLKKIDPLLAQWFERGRSRKDALERKVDPLNMQRLQDLLLKGRNRRDLGGEIIEELGFRLSLWNGADLEEAESSISIQCGCYNQRIGNNVLIDLPCQFQSSPWIEQARSLLALVAEIWRPTWAGIMSKNAIRDRGVERDRPLVDWMVYVPRPIESVPSPSWVEPLKGLGSIIIVQPDPPSGNEVDELPRIRRIEGILAA